MDRPVGRRRLRERLRFVGVGIHGGRPCELTLHPAPFGAGWSVTSQGATCALGPSLVSAEQGSTSLSLGMSRIGTVEHWLAAMHLLGITDGHAVFDGNEVPALDGCALAFVQGCRPLIEVSGPTPVPLFAPSRTLVVAGYGGWAKWRPDAPFDVSVQVDFGPNRRGQAQLSGCSLEEIASAQTFVCEEHIVGLLAQGKGRGANEGNTWSWGTDAPELGHVAARHKLLDALGDLYVLGPIGGSVEIVRGSHRLHQALVSAAKRSWA